MYFRTDGHLRSTLLGRIKTVDLIKECTVQHLEKRLHGEVPHFGGPKSTYNSVGRSRVAYAAKFSCFDQLTHLKNEKNEMK